MSVMKDAICAEEQSTSIAARQKLKITFLEREKDQQQEHIQNLEATLAINKQVIQDLCNTMLDSGCKAKAAIEKLNKENALLHGQVHGLIKARNDAEGQALIYAQIVEENKRREAEHLQEYKEGLNELREQLNKKEFMLQTLEKRCCDAEQTILKYLKNMPEARAVLAQMQITVNDQVGITNVVDQNKLLTAKLAQLTAELARLKHRRNYSQPPPPQSALMQQYHDLRLEHESLKAQLAEAHANNLQLGQQNEELQKQLQLLRFELAEHSRQPVQPSQGIPTAEANRTLSELSSIGCEPQPVALEANISEDLPVVLELNVKDIHT